MFSALFLSLKKQYTLDVVYEVNKEEYAASCSFTVNTPAPSIPNTSDNSNAGS